MLVKQVLCGLGAAQKAVRMSVLRSDCPAGREVLRFGTFAWFVTAVGTSSLNNFVCMVGICIYGKDKHVRSA